MKGVEKMNILDKIKDNGIVAVIRGAKLDNIVAIAEALRDGGVKTLEITMETTNALGIIERVTSEMGDEIIVGAGTVLDPETARAAIMAGATFIFSPTVNLETIKVTKRYGTISIPGALTPSEILTAYENGADIIKVFPANVFGPNYLKDIHGPMPQIPLMPTGGINLTNVGDYVRAGAVAIGVGSSLFNSKEEITHDYYTKLTDRAKQFTAEWEKAKTK